MTAARIELGRLWREYRLRTLGAMTLAAIGFGIAGWAAEGKSAGSAVYRALQLFVLNYDGPDAPKWPLEIARFLAPLTTGLAAVTALTALLRESWDVARAWRKRRHVIVCGLGRGGVGLVGSLRAEGREVVVVEGDGANAEIGEARRLGAIVILGDPASQTVLQRAGVERASHLIAIARDDAVNAAIVAAARRVSRPPSDQLAVLAHIARPELADELTGATLADDGDRPAIEWFSLHERAAHTMLATYADLLGRSRTGDGCHLVVVGTSEVATSLVLGAVRQWMALAPPDGPTIRVTVVAGRAGEWVASLAARHPSIARSAELVVYEDDPRAAADRSELARRIGDASAVFFCTEDDAESAELAYLMRRAAPEARIVLGLQLLDAAAFQGLVGPEIGVFGVTEHALTAKMLTDGVHETLARSIHRQYMAQIAASGRAHRVPQFDDLPETLKQANRAQARDLGNKLRAMGCGIRPMVDWTSDLIELTEDEVERLAQSEHERWSRERAAAGWSRGKARDDAHRVHPYLGDWLELPEDIRDYDRAFVRELPRTLAAVGYEMFRTSAPGDAEPADAAGVDPRAGRRS